MNSGSYTFKQPLMEENKVEHTPLPWFQSHIKGEDGMYSTKIYDHRDIIATLSWYPVKVSETKTATSREANAEFIVLACNSHYDLLDACQAILNPDKIHPDIAKEMVRIAVEKATKK